MTPSQQFQLCIDKVNQFCKDLDAMIKKEIPNDSRTMVNDKERNQISQKMVSKAWLERGGKFDSITGYRFEEDKKDENRLV